MIREANGQAAKMKPILQVGIPRSTATSGKKGVIPVIAAHATSTAKKIPDFFSQAFISIISNWA